MPDFCFSCKAYCQARKFLVFYRPMRLFQLFTRMDESTRSGLTRDIQSIHEETEQKLLFNESIPAGRAKAARKAHDIDKEVPR